MALLFTHSTHFARLVEKAIVRVRCIHRNNVTPPERPSFVDVLNSVRFINRDRARILNARVIVLRVARYTATASLVFVCVPKLSRLIL